MFDPVKDHRFRVAGGVRSGRGGQQRRRYGGIRRAKIQPVFLLECDMRPVSIDPYRGFDHVGRMSPRAFPSTIFFPLGSGRPSSTGRSKWSPFRIVAASTHLYQHAFLLPPRGGCPVRATGPSLRLCFDFTSSFRAD